ncbi:putative phage tail protein [Mitsuokella jalaludinii]|uniref:putative phage tail protein n=1 Tax=Mitsuokella jalaludinii TaxID=187979 RepID=UPI003077D4ED
MILLRNDKVDISQYLPKFLAKDKVMFHMLAAYSAQHEKQRLILDDLSNQFFVQTATWGLAEWERLVGIETDESRRLEDRRTDVLSRLRPPESVTEAFLTKLVNQYMADQQAAVLSHPESYSIDILYHGGQVLDYDGLEDTINTYIPAHIGHTLLTYTKGSLDVYAAGIVRNCKTMRIGMTLQSNNWISPTTLYAAGAIIHQYHNQTIQAGG